MGPCFSKKTLPPLRSARARKNSLRRSPADLLSQYSYVNVKVSEYLKCDITRLKKPNGKTGNTPIDFERLPTAFLDRDQPRRKNHFELNGEKYRRVVGFREILKKREYFQYRAQFEPKKTTSYSVGSNYRFWKIGRGGGKQKGKSEYGKSHHHHKKHGKGHHHHHRKHGRHHEHSEHEEIEEKHSGESRNSESSKSDSKSIKSAKSDPKPDPSKPAPSKPTPSVMKRRSTVLPMQAVRKWKWPNVRRRLPRPEDNPAIPPGKFTVLLQRLYRLPRTKEERDNEWLYLSSTPSEGEEDDTEVDHTGRQLKNYMVKDISYESQKMHKSFEIFWILNIIMGRAFINARKNFRRGRVDYTCKHPFCFIPFLLTSVFLWAILGMSILSYVNVYGHEKFADKNDTDPHGPYDAILMIEIRKHTVPALVILANLLLVATFSLSVILGEGHLIAHYLNQWSTVVGEMETSATAEIQKKIIKNLVFYVASASIYITLFIFKWPKSVRGHCLTSSSLFLRPLYPDLRSSPDLWLFEVAGLLMHLYILFCSRWILCFLHICAQMLYNVCRMWNLKFALRFQLLVEESRGELLELKLRYSLAKLWRHHRLILLLIKNYGRVFSLVILVFIFTQTFVFTLVLSSLIIDTEGELRKRYGGDASFSLALDDDRTVTATYFYSVLEHKAMAGIILCFVAADILFTLGGIVSVNEAFHDGEQFIKRTEIALQPKSHERRFLLSLQWSLSPTRFQGLSANGYFYMTWSSIREVIPVIALVFGLLVRSPQNPFEGLQPSTCSSHEILVNGVCVGTNVNNLTEVIPEYYFLMNDCVEIEKQLSKYSDIDVFEYYKKSGANVVADQPPFQICRITFNKGTSLPDELEKIGRYFEDFGSPKIKATLDAYYDQTIDYQKLNYLDMKGARRSDKLTSTSGGFCGPEPAGRPGRSCEWVEYYRDCVVLCHSNYLNRNLLIPKMYRKTGFKDYLLYSDYHKIDCGLNPFGWKFKGDQYSVEDPAYDCFGNLVNVDEFDLCSNLPKWREPINNFLPAIGDEDKLYRGYTSDWTVPAKSFVATVTAPTPPPPPSCDKCYNFQVSEERCSEGPMVHQYCPIARYWGEKSPTLGYYLIDECLKLHLPSQIGANGLCKYEYFEGGIIVGHVVTQAEYDAAKADYWEKEYTYLQAKLEEPCKDLTNGRPALDKLHRQHFCIHPDIFKNQLTCSPVDPTLIFDAYRPYQKKGCIFKQVPLDYDSTDGNKEICDFATSTIKVPFPYHYNVNLNVAGKQELYEALYGCGGLYLLPAPTPRITTTCVRPAHAGVCEVNALFGSIFKDDYEDISQPPPSDVLLLGDRVGPIASQDNLLPHWSMHSLMVDLSTNKMFEDYKRKVFPIGYVRALLGTKSWTSTTPRTVTHVILNQAPVILNQATKKTEVEGCEDPHYCGENSVALHYPFDGRVSDAVGDRFLCNWVAYYRDCMQPWNSSFANGVVYLPKTIDENSMRLPTNHRSESDILFNVFGGKDYVSCDNRKLPAVDRVTDLYWMDECGWRVTPEFVDGDFTSIAVMLPFLPIPHVVWNGDGIGKNKSTIHYCYETDYALFRCTHPDIFPICKHNLTIWEEDHGPIIDCYRFSFNCYIVFNKEPSGSDDPAEPYPFGFCKGYCPQIDTEVNGDQRGDAIHPRFVNKKAGRSEKEWMQMTQEFKGSPHNLNPHTFMYAPCLYGLKDIDVTWYNGDDDKHRPVEHHLMFEVHCGPPPPLRDHRGITSTFHWPMYRVPGEWPYKLQHAPLSQIIGHLKKTFGPDCNYITEGNESSIYPTSIQVEDVNGTLVDVPRADYRGCHGFHLIHFTEEFKLNKDAMNFWDIKDPRNPNFYTRICYGELYAGWCELDYDKRVFLKDDFENHCQPGKDDVIKTPCPDDCHKMYGHFKNTTLETFIKDEPFWTPFVRSTIKLILAPPPPPKQPRDHRRPRYGPMIPSRYVTEDDFDNVITPYWTQYLDTDPQVQKKYLDRYIRMYKDQEDWAWGYRCYYKDKKKFEAYCSWTMYLMWAMMPCRLVNNSTHRYITEVSQSLVEPSPGLPDMYLRPLPIFFNFEEPNNDTESKMQPAFSFVDCVVDPATWMRIPVVETDPKNSTYFWIKGGVGQTPFNFTDDKIDDFKYVGFWEFLPDWANRIPDPYNPTFEWIPWTLQQPTKILFNYELLTSYVDPAVTYGRTPSRKPAPPANLFLSPYLNCYRMTQENMRVAVLTALRTYWDEDVVDEQALGIIHPVPGPGKHPRFHQTFRADYTYHPSWPQELNICYETAVLVYVDWSVCQHYDIPSKVLKIYGFCKAIFPAGMAHSSSTALHFKPADIIPSPCYKKTFNSTYFNLQWEDRTIDFYGAIGFGMEHGLVDVYKKWSSLCHACGYTRELHEQNMKNIFCGHKKDASPQCQSELESRIDGHAPAVPGHGILYPDQDWFNRNDFVRNIGVLWKIGTQYACYNNAQWQRHSRWVTYHPWSQVNEAKDVAVYAIHVAMNALDCTYPCKGPDESQDCNTNCPLENHNPCPGYKKFFNYSGQDMGLKYTVTLMEGGTMCTTSLQGLGRKKTQGLQMFGAFGPHIVITDQNHRNRKEGIFKASSEAVMRGDRRSLDPNNPDSSMQSGLYYHYHYPNNPPFNSLYYFLHQDIIPMTSWEAPRFLAVHPANFSISTVAQDAFSLYCAGFEGDCEVTKVEWDFTVDPALNTADLIQDHLIQNPTASPGRFLKVTFDPSCTTNDMKLVEYFLNQDPTKPDYCCIPNQKDREHNTIAADVWGSSYFKVVEDMWTKCGDQEDAQKESKFGWMFKWDKQARYLDGCTFDDCKTSALHCNRLLSTDGLCTIQYDPNESFLTTPLPTCNLPK